MKALGNVRAHCAILVCLALVDVRPLNAGQTFDTPLGRWQNEDIGNTGARGTGAYTNQTFVVRGAGADIWDSADAFHYTFQPWRGDCGFIARIVQVDNTDSFARAGIMFRASVDPASPHVFVSFRAGGRMAFQTRTMTGENRWGDGSWIWAPYWMKLVRFQNIFSAYESPDGLTWTLLDSVQLDMPEDFLAGFAVVSGRLATLCAATLDNVQLASIPSAPSGLVALRTFDSIQVSWRDNSTNELGFNVELRPWDDFVSRNPLPPNTTNYTEQYYLYAKEYRVSAMGISNSPYSEVAIPVPSKSDRIPAPWRSTDIGPVAVAGCAFFRDGEFRIGGSGDFGGTNDTGHFAWQRFSGDGEIVARFPDIYVGTFFDHWMKAGLMFRQSLESDSPNAFIFLTTGYGLVSQFRAARGAETAQFDTIEWRYPELWLRLKRSGNRFTGYIGGQGFDWGKVLEWEIPMTDPIYVGMAVSSHKNDLLQISPFKNVRIASSAGSLHLTRAADGLTQLFANGEFDRTYQIQASTNLLQWISLTNRLNRTGTFTFTDSDAATYARRFYRLMVSQ